jgi:hypothetical protein
MAALGRSCGPSLLRWAIIAGQIIGGRHADVHGQLSQETDVDEQLSRVVTTSQLSESTGTLCNKATLSFH